jgi:hypothetical protein
MISPRKSFVFSVTVEFFEIKVRRRKISQAFFLSDKCTKRMKTHANLRLFNTLSNKFMRSRPGLSVPACLANSRGDALIRTRRSLVRSDQELFAEPSHAVRLVREDQ